MNRHPEKLLVRAIIPNSNDPELYVTDKAGRYPSGIDSITTSQEELLHKIGLNVLCSAHLAIDIQVKRRTIVGTDGKDINVSDLRTEPINPDKVALNPAYKWTRV